MDILKTLSGSVREYKKPTVMTMVYVFLEVLFEVIIPFLMAKLIDNGIEKGDMNYIIKISVMILVLALICLLCGTLAGREASISSCGYASNLRFDMYKNIQKFSFTNLDKYSTPGLVTRLTTDVTNIQNAFMLIIRTAIRGPFMIIFSLIAAYRINVEISMVFLITVPILGFVFIFITIKAHPVFERVFKMYDNLNRIVQENLRGIRVVKTFVREKFEVKKFNKISEKIFKDFTKGEKIIAFNTPALQATSYACMVLIAWLGAKAIIESGNNPAIGLTTGGLTSLATYAAQILMSLMRFSLVFVMIIISRASAERITEILNEKSNIVNNDNPLYEVKNGEIEYKDVCFSYSETADKLCLENINLKIKSGSSIGIIGATGSSKSSLVQLIPRLYDVKCGKLLVGGEDVRNYDIETLRNKVSVVLQKNELFSGTIKENLRWGKEDATDEEIEAACKQACAHDFISEFEKGYDTYIEQGGTNVSGGQKQRLCIARAILKKPLILILDDSTSAIDTKTDARIQKMLNENSPETTKIIIAQRINSVKEMDKIIVMEEGRIIASGKHEELLSTCDIYKEIFTSQVKGGLYE